MDLNGFNPNEVPTTDGLRLNIQAFLEPIDNWWLDKLREMQHVDVDPEDLLTLKGTGIPVQQETHPLAAQQGKAIRYGWLQYPVRIDKLQRNFLESKHGKHTNFTETEFLQKLRELLPRGTEINLSQKTMHMPSYIECKERAYQLCGIKEGEIVIDSDNIFQSITTTPPTYRNPLPDPSKLQSKITYNILGRK